MNDTINKVYIVTSGEYSDYRIEKVFSSLLLAQEYIRERDMGWAKIEVYHLDKITKNKISIGFCINIKKNGEIKNIHERVDGFSLYPPEYILAEKELLLRLCIESESKERAIKIAAEKHALVVASGFWGETEKLQYIIK